MRRAIYLVTLSGEDEAEVEVKASVRVTVMDAKGEQGLFVVPDQDQTAEGETTKFTVHSGFESSRALLTIASDVIVEHRFIELNAGPNTLAVPVTGAHWPNFHVSVCALHDNKLQQAGAVLKVRRALNIAFDIPAGKVSPGEQIRVGIQTRDQNGKAVAANLHLRLLDSLLHDAQEKFNGYLVWDEPIPAGCVLVPDTIHGNFAKIETTNGGLRLYFRPGKVESLGYQLCALTPGKFAVPPAQIRDAYHVDKYNLGESGTFEILVPGAKSPDPYQMNSGEQFGLATHYFENDQFPEAEKQLFDWREKEVKLDLKEEGAYLVICRGDDLFASGLVLITPLKLEVRENVEGSVRLTVRDLVRHSYVADAEVKAVGSADEKVRAGTTDPRGALQLGEINGKATVIVRKEGTRYAFYRGDQVLGNQTGAANAIESSPQSLGKPLEKSDYLKNIQTDNMRLQRQSQSEWKQRRIKVRVIPNNALICLLHHFPRWVR